VKRPGFDDDEPDTTPRLPMEAVLEALGVRWPPHGLSMKEILNLRGFTVTELDLGRETMTLRRFAKENPKGKFYFTLKGAFVVALVNGRLTDTTGKTLDKRFLRTAHRVEDPVVEKPVVEKEPLKLGLVEEILGDWEGLRKEPVTFAQKPEEPATRVRRRRKMLPGDAKKKQGS
jgi:hypothetical protein